LFDTQVDGYNAATLPLTIARAGFSWIVIEVRGSSQHFGKQLAADMIHFEELRAAIANALSSATANQARVASRWASFLKPRIEILDYWANLTGAVGAALVACCVLLSFVGSSGKSINYYCVMLGTALGVTAGMLKFEIDRRRFWYKYLVSHLDAINLLASRET
jgi:hypothetical protein